MTTRYLVGVYSLGLMASLASGATVTGFNAATFDNSDPDNITLTGLTFDSVSYTSSQFVYGTTQRYYNVTGGGTAVWSPELSTFPVDGTAVAGTSTPKVYDVGSDADNNIWRLAPTDGGLAPDMASIDGLPFLQTIFAAPVTEIFLFERGSGDPGSLLPILSQDGSVLGTTPLTLAYSQVVGISIDNQNVQGFVYQPDSPVWGFRVSASGLDALSILAVPEPSIASLFGLSLLGLAARRRRS